MRSYKKFALPGFILVFLVFNQIHSRFNIDLKEIFNLMLLAFGIFLGYYFVIFEKLIQIFYLYPDNEKSSQIRRNLPKSPSQAFSLLNYLLKNDFSPVEKPILGSFLFHSAWIVLAFFTLTSTSVYFGKGLVMGIGFYILFDLWELYGKSAQTVKNRVFWQISRQLTNNEVQYYLWLITLAFLILTFFFA